MRADQVRARALISRLRVIKLTTALSAAVVAVGLPGLSTGRTLVRDSIALPAAAGDTPITTLSIPLISRSLSAYYDGRLMNTVRISGMPRAHVGLIGGSWEVTPVQLNISDFRYDPLFSG